MESVVTASPTARLVVLLVVLLSSCGESGEDRAEDPGRDLSEQPAVVQQAVDDLAADLGIEPADVDEVEVEQVTWNDGSLGCAQGDTMYTQATVEGQRITITVGGEAYEYHAGGGREPFRCDRPTQ